MREVADSLDNFLEPLSPHLVEQQRKNNGRREPEYQFKQADNNRITEHLPEAPYAENPPEMFKSDPGASHYPKAENIVFERYLNSVHRAITEYRVIKKRRNKKNK